MKTFRKYVASSAVIAGLLLFGSTALALVAGQSSKNDPKPLPGVAAQQAVDQQASRELSSSAELQAEGDDSEGPNHGHCVSYWNHQAKDAGLKGRARGEFVSAIAKDDAAVSNKVQDGGTPDSTCDFGDELATALAGQDSSDTPGKSGEEHGKSGEDHGKSEGKGKSDESHGKSGEEHGNSEGKGRN